MFNDKFNQDSGFAAGSPAYTIGKTQDAGLRAHMIRIFNNVAAGLVVSGVTAYSVATIPSLAAIFMNPMVNMIISFGLIAFLWFGMNSRNMMNQTTASLQVKYYIFTALLGTTLAYWFYIYSGATLARVFFITAAMFAGTSLVGYTTKRDLTSIGGFLIMGLFGIIIASLVNMFMHSSAMSFVISVISVLVFTGLIAFETQNAKRMYNAGYGDEMNNKMAIYSALGLYINFINLMQTLLRIFGNRN